MQKFHFQTFGKSMLPFLVNGDIVNLQKVPFSSLRIDDFITFKRADKYITHRIVYIFPNKKNLITKGDNNPLPDQKISKKDYIGKVFSVKRGKQEININDYYLIQSSFYFDEIIKVSRLLTEKKIDFVFLKGLPLYLYYEKTFPKRIYADCDLLIDPADFIRVAKLFNDLGYFPEKSIKKLPDAKQIIEISFSKQTKNLSVIFDLHLKAAFLMTSLNNVEPLYSQKLVTSFSKELLNNKRLISIKGRQFPVLSEPYLLIYLILHVFHHNFRGYYRYELIKRVWTKSKVSVTDIKLIIRRFKLANFIYPVFCLLSRLYQLKEPRKFSKHLSVSKRSLTLAHELKLIDILSEEPRTKSGIRRFKMIFDLSPAFFWSKILIFAKPRVLVIVIKVLRNRLTLRQKYGNTPIAD